MSQRTVSRPSLVRVPEPWRRLGREEGGSASVELAFLAPVLLSLLAIIILAGNGFDISRKVTQTARTLTDIASQQANIGSSSTTYTYSQILSAASLVIAPYDSSQLSMVLSEIETNGTTQGTVIWSKANGNGVALAVGATVIVPAGLQSSSYVILGTVSYRYNPLQIYLSANAITLSDSIYLAPRASTSVTCCS